MTARDEGRRDNVVETAVAGVNLLDLLVEPPVWCYISGCLLGRATTANEQVDDVGSPVEDNGAESPDSEA